MSNFIDEGLVLARHEDSMKLIAPQVADLVEKRDALGAKLVALELKISGLEEAKGKAEQELRDLQAGRAETALAGGDPLKNSKQRRAVETRIADLADAINDLGLAVEETIVQGKAAQLALFEGWKLAEAEYIREIQEEFNALHKKLSKFHASFLPAMKRTHAAILQLPDFPKFSLPHPQGRPETQVSALKLMRSHTIYELQRLSAHEFIGNCVLV
jgi:predicted  nucleic acid-binding Zn-ribbon protein